jgi:hypothetical protein
MIGGDLDLLDPCFLVTVDPDDAEEKLLEWRLTPDEVIRRAQPKVGISDAPPPWERLAREIAEN